MIAIFVLVISIFLGLMHLIIYEALISLFTLSTTGQLILGIILVVLCFSFVLSSVFNFNFNNLFTRIYYRISAAWLGMAFYLFLVSCLYVLALSVLPTSSVSILNNFGILFFALAVVVSIYGFFHARNILIKNVNIVLPNLPKGWEGKKAVFISDIHLGAVNGENFAKKIVTKINELNPEMVLIGGDLYDGVKVNELAIVKPFADLHPTLGTYFVTGNHEEFRDNSLYLKAIRNIGISVLTNEILTINGLQLVGVDDRDSINAEKFKVILENLKIDKNKPTILLKHQPLQLDIAEKAGINLQISGHTHKAQVFPLNISTHFIFKGYDYGFRMLKKMAVYTSSGVGTWGPPLRVGSDSEIVVLTFTTPAEPKK
ncbi:MAG: metallophosphoesterase [Candidatus Pacebacteria bacterium]|nr:metallophosphoesterase [Candidatus Paceibacterota bacterium]